MDARVAQLETHIDYIREHLTEIRTDLRETQREMAKSFMEVNKTIAETNKALMELRVITEKLPTKADLWAFKAQWLAIIFVGCATIIAGIIGGLDWIKTH